MSAANWLQLAILIALLLVTTRVVGAYVAGVFGGGKALGDRVFLPVERLVYRVCGVDPEREQTWPAYTYSLLSFSLVSVLGLYALQRLQGALPLNPTDVDRRAAGARIQHRRLVRDEHELAELRGRADDESPHADGRARRAELRLGRRRPLRRDRVDPRARTPHVPDDRELLGRPHARHAAAAAPARRRLRPRAREPGDRAELPRLHPRDDACRAPRSRSPAARSRARR